MKDFAVLGRVAVDGEGGNVNRVSDMDRMIARATELRVTTSIAEKIPIASACLVDQKILRDSKINAREGWEDMADWAANRLIIELRSCIHGIDKSYKEIHVKWPKNWKEAFKEQWFPVWALKRWPVLYERVDHSVKIYGKVCPHIVHGDYSPENNPCLEWLAVEE